MCDDNNAVVGFVDIEYPEDSIEVILETCRRVKNHRDHQSVFNHLKGEVDELDREIDKVYCGIPAGPDGILGESVDVILCAVDMMFMDNPNITISHIMNKITEKLAKWERIYGQPK